MRGVRVGEASHPGPPKELRRLRRVSSTHHDRGADDPDPTTHFARVARGPPITVASVMKTVPHFLRGPFRSAMRLALEEANEFNDNRRERGWKLFMLLPRLLLFRPPRGGNIHKSKLAQRFSRISLKVGG